MNDPFFCGGGGGDYILVYKLIWALLLKSEHFRLLEIFVFINNSNMGSFRKIKMTYKTPRNIKFLFFLHSNAITQLNKIESK